MRLSGLSFFLASNTVTLNPWLYYILYPVIGGVVLACILGVGKLVRTNLEEKTLEEKSSKELLLEIARKLLPSQPDALGKFNKGWIAETDDRLGDLAGRLSNVEMNQETTMVAQGVPLNNSGHHSDLTKTPNPVKES